MVLFLYSGVVFFVCGVVVKINGQHQCLLTVHELTVNHRKPTVGVTKSGLSGLQWWVTSVGSGGTHRTDCCWTSRRLQRRVKLGRGVVVVVVAVLVVVALLLRLLPFLYRKHRGNCQTIGSTFAYEVLVVLLLVLLYRRSVEVFLHERQAGQNQSPVPG